MHKTLTPTLLPPMRDREFVGAPLPLTQERVLADTPLPLMRPREDAADAGPRSVRLLPRILLARPCGRCW